ncbi:MAG TPA: CidA/LrgA family protein, partial [Sutterellaceae bacterium]|nr:CidA/LrgA family protein [Sutterellaceae bacterium]
STILTIAVTALVIKYSTIWLQKRKERKEARHE